MIPESGRIPFYVFFFVMIGLCFLPALVFPAGEAARIDLGIRVEELKTARDNIAMDIGVRAEVVAMKKEKGMAYHDNTALKKISGIWANRPETRCF